MKGLAMIRAFRHLLAAWRCADCDTWNSDTDTSCIACS
jgi:hypothetical protein